MNAYHIEYVYLVNDIEYRSESVARGYKTERVDELLGKFPRGASVTVHYDAKHPDIAILEPSRWLSRRQIVALVVLLLAPLIFSVRTKKRRNPYLKQT